VRKQSNNLPNKCIKTKKGKKKKLSHPLGDKHEISNITCLQ
jgi:hypothetical protein